MLVRIGSKQIVRKGAGGKFWCYSCNSEQGFERSDTHDYFTFQWIPFFSQGVVASTIRCLGCGEIFTGDALQGMTEQQLSSLLMRVKKSLSEGGAIEDVSVICDEVRLPSHQKKLIMRNATQANCRRCPQCAKTYLPSLSVCAGCKLSLSEPEPCTVFSYDIQGLFPNLKLSP